MTDSLEGKWRYLVRVLVLRDGNLNRVRKLCWKKNNPCDQEHLVMIFGQRIRACRRELWLPL